MSQNEAFINALNRFATSGEYNKVGRSKNPLGRHLPTEDWLGDRYYPPQPFSYYVSRSGGVYVYFAGGAWREHIGCISPEAFAIYRADGVR